MKYHFAAALVAVPALMSAAPAAAHGRHITHQHHHSRLTRSHARPAARFAAKAARHTQDIAPWLGQTGIASYYGPAHQGRLSASGRIFNEWEMTAAHPWLPFGTKVRVVLASTGRSIVVTITDRLYSSRRIVDLSLGAARELGMLRQGIAQVTLEPAKT